MPSKDKRRRVEGEVDGGGLRPEREGGGSEILYHTEMD